MFGVRSLSTALSVALVVCTGVLVGTLSITTGQKTTSDARAAGDRGVAATLESGDKDIRQMAAQYLQSVTHSVETELEGILNGVTLSLKQLQLVGETARPEQMTANGTSEFLSTIVRAVMRQTLVAHHPSLRTVTYRWGHEEGYLAQSTFDIRQAYASSGRTVWAMVESQLPSSTDIVSSPYIVIGHANERGEMIGADKPCYILTTGKRPDVDEVDFGRCLLPKEAFFRPGYDDYYMKLWARENNTDGTRPMAESKKIIFSETVPFYSWLSMDVHVPLEHPDYVDPLAVRYPHRFGYFTLAVQMEHISDVFTTMAVPEGAILYCVDKNPFSGDVGKLIATNYGQLTEETVTFVPGSPLPARAVNQIYAVNHTFDADTPYYSPTAYHARHIFATYPNNYADAALATDVQGAFVEWTAPIDVNDTNTTQATTYWYTTAHMEYENLNWFISILVPRSSIMDSIDASVAAVREQRAEDKAASDDYERRSLAITIVVTVIAACVLMALSALVTGKILSPLMNLEREMAHVAVMRVEQVNMTAPLSKLSEVRAMEQSFRLMVDNLLEYKQYMPQSVLVSDDERDDVTITSVETTDNPDLSRSARSHSESRVSNSSKSNVQNSSGSSFAAIQPTRGITANSELRRKAISVVAYNLRGYLTLAARLQDAELQRTYAQVMTIMLTTMRQFKGVCDTFAGDRFIIAHNAFNVQNTHKVASIQAAIHIKKLVASLAAAGADDAPVKISMSFGASTGEARVGQMGCSGMKKVTITSAVVPWAAALEQYSKVRRYEGVVDSYMAQDVASAIVLRKTDVVVSPKRTLRQRKSTAMPIGVYEAVQEQEVDNDEWMYQLESASSANNVYAQWNTMFDELAVGNISAAKELYMRLAENVCTGAERARLGRIVACGHYELISIDQGIVEEEVTRDSVL